MLAMRQTDVLVVGAGPAGLTLACDLARRGVAVRIIDRVPEFPHGSRGKGLSPRSLEVFDDLGVADRLLKSGATHLPHRKYRGAEIVAEIDPEAGLVVTPDIPYPAGLMIPQWRVEQTLRERLANFGVAVELGAELSDFSQGAGGVTATAAGTQIRAQYLAGCDGGRSTVRKALGLRLHGQTPDIQLMAAGDVEVDGLGRDAWHQWFAGDSAIMLCPLPGTAAFQVQASHELGPDGTPLEPTLETFQQTFDRIAAIPGVRLHNLTWHSSYRVNVRMVDRLRVGRVFLAGDAAHVHPIAGGLGMNSGIQDTYNLGWKLGLVLAGKATPGLLDTYDEERLPIAGWLLNITSERLDAVLAAIKESGGGVDAVASPELTQLQLGYRWSRLSGHAVSRPSGPRPGDRAPDAPCRDPFTGTPKRLFDVFRGPHFTLLGLGERCAAALSDLRSDTVKPCLIGPGGLIDDAGHAAQAYGPDALILVRPDGYIGLIAGPDDTLAVAGYLRSLMAAGPGSNQPTVALSLYMSRSETKFGCVSCGDELHPERAEKYDYCMKPECQAKNLKSLTMVAVGVNKSAEQYLLLDDDTKAELAQGKYHDQRRGTFGQPGPAPGQPRPAVPAQASPASAAPAAPRGPRLPGTASQRRLAALYNQQGLRPDEIARKLGLSRYDVTQIILAARSRGRS
jgi:2-polyprenyl-6-methoxyphenol hydroxylase-like FAD-dependent oxidoreductase